LYSAVAVHYISCVAVCCCHDAIYC